MNFRQIEVFRAIVETGSASGAALRLLVTQPAVSKVLSQLERTLGLELFIRTGRQLRPTEAAMALYTETERAFLGLTHLDKFAKGLREGPNKRLVIGAMTSLASCWMPRVVTSFLDNDSSLTVSLQAIGSARAAEWVASNQVDLGIGYVDYSHPAVRSEVLASVDVVCILPQGHRLARRKLLKPADLHGEDFVSMPSTNRHRIAFEELLKRAEVSVRTRIETRFSTTICALVSQGAGIALVEYFIAAELAYLGFEIRRLTPSIQANLHILRSPSALQATLAEDFIAHLKSDAKKVNFLMPRENS